MYMENRFKMLTQTHPEAAKELLQAAQRDVSEHWHRYEHLAAAKPPQESRKERDRMDLSTTYLGLALRTPLVPSASPLSSELEHIRRMEDAGASAVVLYSLFEEQIALDRFELDHHLTSGTESFAEALTLLPGPLPSSTSGRRPTSTTSGRRRRRCTFRSSPA